MFLTRQGFVSGILLSLCFNFASCGKGSSNQFVKSVSVQTKDVDGSQWVSLTSTIEISGAQLPSLTLPVADPRNPSEVYGQISFRPVMGTLQSQVELGVDLTKVANLPSYDYATLPNGNALPFSVPVGIEVVELSIPQINSKVYLALGPQTIMFGWAITIKEFDAIARYLPGANIFLGFNLGPVRGNAGIFTSTTPGENGLALFADIGQAVFPQQESSSKQFELASSDAQEPIRFKTNTPSTSQLRGLSKSAALLRNKKLQLN